jgi:hypothetical protein
MCLKEKPIMKKLATSVSFALGIISLTSPALAEGADVLRTNGCIVFDANGVPVFDPEAQVQIVNTNNKNGNISATCKGQLPAPGVLPDRALRFNFENTGFFCIVPGNEDWQEVVTPSGQAHLTCHAPVEDF